MIKRKIISISLLIVRSFLFAAFIGYIPESGILKNASSLAGNTPNPNRPKYWENDIFSFTPSDGTYMDVDIFNNYKWIIDIKEKAVDPKSMNNVTVNLVNNRNNIKYLMSPGNGITIEGLKIIVSPPDIDYDKQISYNISVEGLKDKEGSPVSAKRKISLLYRSEESIGCPVYSGKYEFDYRRGLITGIKPFTPIKSFIKNVSATGHKVGILNESGRPIGSGYIGTGKIVVFSISGEVKYRFITVVDGDLNGDGRSSINDVNILKKYLLSGEGLEGPFLLAADMNHDGKVDSVDVLILNSSVCSSPKVKRKRS